MNTRIIETTSGSLTGIEENGCMVYKGIPYAEPPLGPLRWRSPAPVRWEGVRHCDRFSRKCPQKPGMMGTEQYYAIPESEDCLYLNISTPLDADAPLPVLFWIHGGGFLGGTGNEDVFQSPALVSGGAVLVTINYRLGVFGFLALEELAEESADGSFGNYGIEDQIAALRWVRENIAAFGGDPERITVFGQSAGGMSVLALLESPRAGGLISGAIIQSGSSLGRTRSSGQAAGVGRKVLEECRCSSVEELRNVPAEELLEAGARLPWPAFSPSVDGVLITEDPGLAFIRGETADVPVIIGTNADEALFSPLRTDDPAAFEENLRQMLGEEFSLFAKLYPGWRDDFAAVSAEAGSDYGFALTQFMLEKHAEASSSPVYQYYFADRPLKDNGEVLGATHSAELNYLFGHPELQAGSTPDGRRWEAVHTAEQYDLAKLMSALWVSFAGSGLPEAGNVKWLPLGNTAEEPVMHFVSGNAGCRIPDQQAKLLLWKTVLEKQYSE